MPQSACISAFHWAWVSDHGGEGGGVRAVELMKARARGADRERERTMAVVTVTVPMKVTAAGEQERVR